MLLPQPELQQLALTFLSLPLLATSIASISAQGADGAGAVQRSSLIALTGPMFFFFLGEGH